MTTVTQSDTQTHTCVCVCVYDLLLSVCMPGKCCSQYQGTREPATTKWRNGSRGSVQKTQSGDRRPELPASSPGLFPLHPAGSAGTFLLSSLAAGYCRGVSRVTAALPSLPAGLADCSPIACCPCTSWTAYKVCPHGFPPLLQSVKAGHLSCCEPRMCPGACSLPPRTSSLGLTPRAGGMWPGSARSHPTRGPAHHAEEGRVVLCKLGAVWKAGHPPTASDGFLGDSAVMNSPTDAGNINDASLSPGSGRSPGKGNGNPLQYSCLENLTDRSLAGYSPQGHRET